MSLILIIVLVAAGVFLLSLVTLIRMSLADKRAQRRWQEQGIDSDLQT